MGGNMLYGLLCVRLLPVSDYAKFAVLFGYMGSLTMLLDVGMSGTLAPLVGEQVSNLRLIADYVASLRKLALKVYAVFAPVAGVAFIFLVQRQHWGAVTVTQMLLVLLCAAWFARISASYGAVLILRRDRDYYYRVQIVGSLGSLGLLVGLWALHGLNLYVAILLNFGQTLFTATCYYRRAGAVLGVKGHAAKRQEQAIVRLAVPNVPGAVFYALQGQLMLVLITLFGHGVTSIANVGALTRLGQILAFASQMNPILLEPYFAKLQAARVKRTYLLTLGLVTAAGTLFTTFAFLFPEVFLWVLGPKYSQLRLEVGLVILSSAISYVSGCLWVINSARRFVYWWNTLLNIASIVVVQALFIWKLDLSTVKGVLLLNIATAITSLSVMMAGSIYGFVRGPQTIERQSAG